MSYNAMNWVGAGFNLKYTAAFSSNTIMCENKKPVNNVV